MIEEALCKEEDSGLISLFTKLVIDVRTDSATSRPELAPCLTAKEESLVFHSFSKRSQIFSMELYPFFLAFSTIYQTRIFFIANIDKIGIGGS